MSKTYKFLKSAGPFFVATNEGDQPHVRAFTAVAEFNGKLCIGTNKNKKVYQQLMANPKVELCSITPDRKWVRVEGEVSLENSDEACQAFSDYFSKNVFTFKLSFPLTHKVIQIIYYTTHRAFLPTYTITLRTPHGCYATICQQA